MKKLAPSKTFQLRDLKRLSNDDLRCVTGGEDKVVPVTGFSMSKAIY
jgi:hypothetical protein